MSVPGWNYVHRELEPGEKITVGELILELLRHNMEHEVVLVGEEPVKPGTTMSVALKTGTQNDLVRTTSYAPSSIWCNNTQLIIRGRKIK